jgi:hypothetical protein
MKLNFFNRKADAASAAETKQAISALSAEIDKIDDKERQLSELRQRSVAGSERDKNIVKACEALTWRRNRAVIDQRLKSLAAVFLQAAVLAQADVDAASAKIDDAQRTLDALRANLDGRETRATALREAIQAAYTNGHAPEQAARRALTEAVQAGEQTDIDKATAKLTDARRGVRELDDELGPLKLQLEEFDLIIDKLRKAAGEAAAELRQRQVALQAAEREVGAVGLDQANAAAITGALHYARCGGNLGDSQHANLCFSLGASAHVKQLAGDALKGMTDLTPYGLRQMAGMFAPHRHEHLLDVDPGSWSDAAPVAAPQPQASVVVDYNAERAAA